MNLYSYTAVENLINTLMENANYEVVQLNEGSLGYGDLVLIAPDENHWNFVVREVAINEWSSGHTVRRCKKISKKLQKEIDSSYEREIA